MVFSGPTPEKSAVADSDFAEISACLETDSWSISPPLACGPSDWQWHPSLAGDKLAPGKIAHSVGEAALVDEPPASEVGRGAAAADAQVKTAETAKSPSAPATAPATDAGREDDEARMHDAARLRDEARLDGACYHVVGIWLRLENIRRSSLSYIPTPPNSTRRELGQSSA